MSFIKFSPNLFLEKQELQRFKEFLDNKGFRQFLLANSLRFGLISKQYFQTNLQNEFLNGQITQGAGSSFNYAEIQAIDSNGDFISLDAGNKLITADNIWRWVKIKYQLSSVEKGIVAIDAAGNLTGDSNTRFTEVLRGAPDFPTRIKFTDSIGNLLEYDVLEVISDQLVTLDNNTFVAETNLHYAVVGTFTPASVPPDSDKEIFQYDSCLLELITETSLNTRPTFIEGKEFFLARIKSGGGQIIIQDKRTQLWQVKADFFAKNLKLTQVPFFGIEKVKFNDQRSTLDKNVVYLSWTFKSTNYSVNSNLNILTIIGGSGGKYKKVTDFVNGDFDGYRLYTSDGSYSIIKSSVLTGNQINCYIDVLDIDRYSNDGGSTFHFNEIIVSPDCEEIEVICAAREADESQSLSGYVAHLGEDQLTDQKFIFPINLPVAKLELLAYDTFCNYEITYRLKHIDQYSSKFSMQPDILFGYYTEKAFSVTGDFLPIVSSNNYAQNLAAGYIRTYSSNLLLLSINADAYSEKIPKIDIGDLKGVDTVALTNSIPVVDLFVGTNRQYQFFTGVSLSLSANMFISLKNKFKDLTGATIKNGVSFLLHFKQPITLGTFTFSIVQDFVDPTNFTLIKQFNSDDITFISQAEQGLFIQVTFDGAKWFVNSVNETKVLSILAGNLPNGIKTDNALLKTKVIEIGDWNMDATVSVNIIHGLNFLKIKKIDVIIIIDNSNFIYPLILTETVTGVSAGSVAEVSPTIIRLSRLAGSSFDSTAFDLVPFNRGWITITYEA